MCSSDLAEPVGVQTQFPHQRHIVPIMAVMIAGDIAGIAVADSARGMGELVPDAGTGTIGQRRTFDLVGGSRRAPEEIRGKRSECSHGRKIKGEGEGLKLDAIVVELMPSHQLSVFEIAGFTVQQAPLSL